MRAECCAGEFWLTDRATAERAHALSLSQADRPCLCLFVACSWDRLTGGLINAPGIVSSCSCGATMDVTCDMLVELHASARVLACRA